MYVVPLRVGLGLVTCLASVLATPIAHAQNAGTQPGALRAPLESAGRCTECHSGLEDGRAQPYLAADTWAPSMMANASRDPLFLATLTVAEQDSPGVGTVCLRCHSPGGFTAGRATPGLGTRLDPVEGDIDGVHCDACHRSVVPAGDRNAPYLSNAQIFYEDAPAPGEQPRRHGPRTDPFMSPRHPSVGSAFIRDARMCGQCHDVDHPNNRRVGADGRDTGRPFPLQSTYSEWAQSDFARRATPETCQTCHMPLVAGAALPATRIPNAPVRAMQRRHDFVGANEWGMALLRAAFPGEIDAEFDAARTRTRDFLRAAATLAITASPRETAAGSSASLTVRVTNLSGHKLPTGYEDARVMWLQVQVGDRVVSGAYQNDERAPDAQARVYQFVPGVFAAGRVAPSDFVARHNTVIEDTRIPPLGMRPDERTSPVGRDYSGGPNGALRNYDDATFTLPMPTLPGPATVTVRLMYRTTTRHYVEAIANANRTDDRGRTLLRLYNASGRAAPFAMATATVSINVTPTSPPADDGGCGVRPRPRSSGGLAGLLLGLLAIRRRNRPRVLRRD